MKDGRRGCSLRFQGAALPPAGCLCVLGIFCLFLRCCSKLKSHFIIVGNDRADSLECGEIRCCTSQRADISSYRSLALRTRKRCDVLWICVKWERLPRFVLSCTTVQWGGKRLSQLFFFSFLHVCSK